MGFQFRGCFFALGLAISLTPITAFSQAELMYPGSTLLFSSMRQGPDAGGCAEGGDGNAFIRVVAANGWGFNGISLKSSKSGTANQEIHVSEFEYETVHPDQLRLRVWKVTTTISTQRQPGLVAVTCNTTARFTGDRLDDALEIDIGVQLSSKIKKGEQVNPIILVRPFYCDKNIPSAAKIYGPYGDKKIDCNAIGILGGANKVVQQTENLTEKN